MTSIFGILFCTKKTFLQLDNKFVEDLESRTTLIFVAFGLTVALETFFKDNLVERDISLSLVTFLGGVLFAVLIGRYFYTYIIYWIAKIIEWQG